MSVFLTDAVAQSAENVLLVVNTSSPASMEVGAYYAQRRSVPEGNIVRLPISAAETIDRADYERQLETPLAVWLTRNFAHDRILYIVLTKGVPLRINGTAGLDGTVSSVDTELALLYRKLTGVITPPSGRVNNPYFTNGGDATQRRAFSHAQFDIFLVSRLDGYSVADVRSLIDRGMKPSRDGSIVLDDRSSTNAESANIWLRQASDTVRSLKKNAVVYDTTARVVRDVKPVLGYYSWGSNDPAIRDRQFNFEFSNGALAGMFVSTDGRTMNEPPADWKIGTWPDTATHFAGSPQSLAGDLIRAGITGVAAHVAEPFLDATIRPDVLFPAYLSGASIVEAFYGGMPFLSWQTIVIGDPLCAPFRTAAVSTSEITPPLDAETELPSFFSSHRLRVLLSAADNPPDVRPDAFKSMLRADARIARNDVAGARLYLEQATARDDRLGMAQLMLGMLYDQTADYEKAVTRYRRVLEIAPNNVVVLNNLAYIVGVRQKNTKEALPYAEAAYAANRHPSTADTLAWILHLAGENNRAFTLLTEAVQGAPQNATLRYHYAAVLEATGDAVRARQELAQALQLDRNLAGIPEVQELQRRLTP
jgi:uncharacterized protein (TIGR03790 family)